MDLSRYLSSTQKEPPHLHHSNSVDSTRSTVNKKRYLPLLANPINDNVRQVLSSSLSDLEKASTRGSSETTTFAGNGRTSRGNVIIYKRHHEASTIELFYDLFFIANLAYFTAMHQHTDAQSLINYLKLFTLIWFTWLSTTLFDVRFSIDCVWNRLHKAIQFGTLTSFVFAGPVFDKYSNGHDFMSYKNFAIALAISRAAIAVQYALVMWQGRMFRQTLVPLGLSTLVHILAAVGYGITAAIFPVGVVGLEEQITWVVIAIGEGLFIFLIAIIWRIVSFKYTHLVERLQLLTLIIIGEGIIGMVKSVACITKGQSKNNHTEIGTVVAAVIILYLLWMLYFDQLSHDRFGSVRQQLWSLLHYPLHMAVLLCVEGNTSLIVWNSVVQALQWIWSLAPNDYSHPGDSFYDTEDLLRYLNQSMWAIDARFTSKNWHLAYIWQSNFTAIENYTATYGFRSDEWNYRTGNLVRYMFDSAQVFVFQSHADTVGKLNAVSAPATDPIERLERVFDVFNTTVLQFYVGAGAMLLILSIMYWFNKLHKSKYEFGEMINRLIVGFGVMIVGVAAVSGDKSTGGFKFAASEWIIPIVVLCFVAVLLMDNLLLAISHYTTRRQHRRDIPLGGSTITGDNDTAGLILKFPSSGPPSAPLSQVQTAYTPYDTPRQQDFGSPDLSRSASPKPVEGVGIPESGKRTSGHSEERTPGNHSYQNMPTDAVVECRAVVFAVGPLEQQFEEVSSASGKRRTSRSGYESIRDQGPYANRPVRMNAVKEV